jgi:hypothetical protein
MDTEEILQFGSNVPITGHRCKREWRPIDLNDIPRTCPKCKNP